MENKILKRVEEVRDTKSGKYKKYLDIAKRNIRRREHKVPVLRVICFTINTDLFAWVNWSGGVAKNEQKTRKKLWFWVYTAELINYLEFGEIPTLHSVHASAYRRHPIEIHYYGNFYRFSAIHGYNRLVWLWKRVPCTYWLTRIIPCIYHTLYYRVYFDESCLQTILQEVEDIKSFQLLLLLLFIGYKLQF